MPLAALTLGLASPAPGSVAAGAVAQVDVEVEITNPQPGQRLQGRIDVAGYVSATRTSSERELTEGDVRLYLNDPTDDAKLIGYGMVAQPGSEPTVEPAAPLTRVDFSARWATCTFAPGPYRLIAAVSDPASGATRWLASVDVAVEPCAADALASDLPLAISPLDATRVGLAGPAPSGRWLDPILGDFAAGIDARCGAAAVGCRPAIDFRALPRAGSAELEAGYRFTIDVDSGSFMLGYAAAGGPMVPILPWTVSPAIQPGTATNRLAVLVEGSQLRLFINGQPVGEARDERRRWGRIGWTAETHGDEAAVAVEFSQAVVTLSGPADSLSALLPVPRRPDSSADPAAPARVLFSDDFRNPNSGWPAASSDPASRRVGYDAGEYVVAKVAGADGAPMVTRAERFGDFQVEIDARLSPPTSGGYVFLEFRRHDGSHYYSFAVDPEDGAFIVLRYQGTASHVLIPWTETPAILGGGATNRLAVRARGPELTFSINGQEVGSTRDEAILEGAIAFGVGNVRDGAAEGRFSNLVVSSVD